MGGAGGSTGSGSGSGGSNQSQKQQSKGNLRLKIQGIAGRRFEKAELGGRPTINDKKYIVRPIAMDPHMPDTNLSGKSVFLATLMLMN